jgi:hypothetical protein
MHVCCYPVSCNMNIQWGHLSNVQRQSSLTILLVGLLLDVLCSYTWVSQSHFRLTPITYSFEFLDDDLHLQDSVRCWQPELSVGCLHIWLLVYCTTDTNTISQQVTNTNYIQCCVTRCFGFNRCGRQMDCIVVLLVLAATLAPAILTNLAVLLLLLLSFISEPSANADMTNGPHGHPCSVSK